MTQQEKKQLASAPQEQDLLDTLIDTYQPDVVRTIDLLAAAIDASADDEEINLEEMAAILRGLDETPEPTLRIRVICPVCGQINCPCGYTIEL